MVSLTDIQNFLSKITKELDPLKYPKSFEMLTAFNKLPKNFMEIRNEEIEQKPILEQQIYYLPDEFDSFELPTIEDRKHFIFEKILSIRDIMAEEIPVIVKFLFKFTEAITLKNHTGVMKASKSIWRFILAENIKYDIDNIEQSLHNELKFFQKKDQDQIIILKKSFDSLQNQIKGLNLLSEEDFSRQDLLDICKSIKNLQRKLMLLLKKNKTTLPYKTIRNFKKWNEELNENRLFIARNLHIAREAKWPELESWGKFDRVLYIIFINIAIAALFVGFIQLVINPTKAFDIITSSTVATIACLIGFIFLGLNALRGLINGVIKKINYGLPITTFLTPIVISVAALCHPAQIFEQVAGFLKNIKKIVKFSNQNIAPFVSKIAFDLAKNVKEKFTGFFSLLKQKLPKPWEKISITSYKATPLQETLVPIKIEKAPEEKSQEQEQETHISEEAERLTLKI
jgi:hypothetical protein